jgi:hypothetical protein
MGGLCGDLPGQAFWGRAFWLHCGQKGKKALCPSVAFWDHYWHSWSRMRPDLLLLRVCTLYVRLWLKRLVVALHIAFIP